MRGWGVTSAGSPIRSWDLRLAAIWTAAVGFSIASVAFANEHSGLTFAGRSLEATGLKAGAGLALLAAALYVGVGRRAPRSGVLFALVATAWFLEEWRSPAAGSLAFTAGLVGRGLTPTLACHAVLAHPFGRLASLRERWVIAVAYIDAAIVLGILSAFVVDPAARGCNLCPSNLLAVTDWPELAAALEAGGRLLQSAWLAVFVGLTADRLRRSLGPARIQTPPILLAGAAYAVVVFADALLALTSALHAGPNGSAPLAFGLWVAQAASLLTIGMSVGVPWLWRRRTRARMAQLALELGRSPERGNLQTALGAALGDRDLRLGYAIAGRPGLVDAEGRSIDTEANLERTPIVRDGSTIAVILHRPGILDEPRHLEDVVAASRLALDHERYRAELASRIDDLRRSRARVVAAGDAARRRLERDLHDGAQQRLLALSIGLGRARARLSEAADPSVGAMIDRAEEQLRESIDELRDIAHGLYPAVLTSDGLRAAVDTVKDRAPIVVGVTRMSDQRFAQPIEAAAWFVIAEVTGTMAALSGAARATIDVQRDDERLVVEVQLADARADGPELQARMVEIEDRVGALDGHAAMERGEDGSLVVRGEIPCGS
jgi:signal transduction histidine kinase